LDDKKTEKMSKAEDFRNQYNQFRSSDFEFLAMSNQPLCISDDYKIILPLNKDYFNDGIPKKVIRKIIRKLK